MVCVAVRGPWSSTTEKHAVTVNTTSNYLCILQTHHWGSCCLWDTATSRPPKRTKRFIVRCLILKDGVFVAFVVACLVLFHSLIVSSSPQQPHLIQVLPSPPVRIIIHKKVFIGQRECWCCFPQLHFSVHTSQLGSGQLLLGPLTTGFSSTGILGTEACEVYFCQGEAEHLMRKSRSHSARAAVGKKLS